MNRKEELKLELKNYKEKNKPFTSIETINVEGYGEVTITEEIYKKRDKEEIARLNTEIDKEEIKESVGVLLDSIPWEESRAVIGVFNSINFILQSKKMNPDVLMEILSAIIIAYKMEKGFDCRPLVVLITGILQKFRYDERLMYSVNV